MVENDLDVVLYDGRLTALGERGGWCG